MYAGCLAVRIDDDGIEKLVAVPVTPSSYLPLDPIETKTASIDKAFVLEAFLAYSKERIYTCRCRREK